MLWLFILFMTHNVKTERKFTTRIKNMEEPKNLKITQKKIN